MDGFWLIRYIALWVVVVAQSVALLSLFHHFGQMYLNSREGRADHGPERDSQLARRIAQTLLGSEVAVPVAGRPGVVVFTHTDCELCRELRPALRDLALRHAEVNVSVICAGPENQVRQWAGDLIEVADVIPDRRGRISTAYRIGVTPFLVAVDAHGTVKGKGIVNNLDGLERVAGDALTDEISIRVVKAVPRS